MKKKTSRNPTKGDDNLRLMRVQHPLGTHDKGTMLSIKVRGALTLSPTEKK